MPSSFVVIRGAPGVGKSTVAALLRAHFPSGVCIEVDTLRMMVHANCWKNQEQHENAIELAAAIGDHHASRGHLPVIFVDTFGFGTLQLLTRHLKHADIQVYSLTAADWTIARRLRKRTDHGYKDWLRSIFLNHNILTSPAESDLVVETSGIAPDDVAAWIAERESRKSAFTTPLPA